MFNPKLAPAGVAMHLVGRARGHEDLPTLQEAHILQCALHCFARRGYASTSVRAIAAEAGITAPMINYYFGSKEGLYRRVAELAIRAVDEHLEFASRKDGDVHTRLVGLVTAAIDFGVASPDAAAFLFDALYGSGDRPRADAEALERGLYGVLDRLIASAIARRELRLREGRRTRDLQSLCAMVLSHVIGSDFVRAGRVNPSRRNEMVREAEALLTMVIDGARA